VLTMIRFTFLPTKKNFILCFSSVLSSVLCFFFPSEVMSDETAFTNSHEQPEQTPKANDEQRAAVHAATTAAVSHLL